MFVREQLEGRLKREVDLTFELVGATAHPKWHSLYFYSRSAETIHHTVWKMTSIIWMMVMTIPTVKRNFLWLFVRACPQLPILSLSYPLSALPMLPFHQRSPATTVRCFWKPRSSRHIPSQLWNMVHHLMNEVSVQQFHDVICAKFMNKKQKLRLGKMKLQNQSWCKKLADDDWRRK